MTDYGDEAEKPKKAYRDPYAHLRLCGGCRKGLRPEVFQDDSGGYDGVDADGKPYRPFIAMWGWCDCQTLAAKMPKGWRRCYGSEYGVEAADALAAMADPYITVCNGCHTRLFPVCKWEPGLRRWVTVAELCGCGEGVNNG